MAFQFFLGIGNLDGEPEEKIFMGNEECDSDKKTYLREIATEVVDRFVVNFNCITHIFQTSHTLSLRPRWVKNKPEAIN